MLKQGIENKASKVSDSITGSDGRVYRRADYEDERHPGYSRPGMLFSSFELMACAGWDLIAPSGHRFHAHLPVQSVPDPSHVGRADVPAQLREAADAAWAKLNEVRARMAEAIEKREEAMVALHDATAKGNKAAYNHAVAAGMRAEEVYRAVELEEAAPRKAAADAEQAIKFWQDDERMYRSGQATRPEPTANVF